MKTNSLESLYSLFIDADQEVRERQEDLLKNDRTYRNACAKRDKAWENYQEVKAMLNAGEQQPADRK